MPPPVALAHPHELRPVVSQSSHAHVVHETSTHALSRSTKIGSRRAGARVGEQHVISFWRRLSCWITSSVRAQPSPCARDSGCADRRRSRATWSPRRPRSRRRFGRGVRRAGLRILHRIDERVERVGVVDEHEVPDAARVELPVRDALAVGAPAEAVAKTSALPRRPSRTCR